MAEYLSSSEKENNLNTPPTKEYLEKALDLLFWCCKTYTPTTEEQEEYINDILTRWNDENKEKND